jgi:hypothetical protein
MSNIDKLLNTSPAELIDGLKALGEQRAGIESQEAVLKQLLDLHLAKGGEVGQEAAIFAANHGVGPLREQIRQVFITKRESDPMMLPMAVHAELGARGNQRVTLDNVRVTMKRMADDDELIRPDSESVVYGLPGTPAELIEMVKKAQARATEEGQP